MSTDPILIAQNTAPRRSSAPSLVPDEWGGSDLNNPELSRLDFAAARANVQLINQIVRSRGGSAEETEPLVINALRKMSERGPFGHVGNAFLYGATSELLERAQQMSPTDFNHYLRNLETKCNPLDLFERTRLDELTEDAKSTTRQHIQQSRGEQSFRFFGWMEGQNGALAFSAGAADAITEEFGRGARDLIVTAANPLEAGRQVTNLAGSLGQLPAAVQNAYRELQTEVARWGESDYRKGYLSAQAVLIALDAADAVETLGNLARRMRRGSVDFDDAVQALEDGRGPNRQNRTPDNPSGDTPGNSGNRLPSDRPRTPDPTPAPDPIHTPSGRQTLPGASQAALITDSLGIEGALGRELNAEILRWAQGKPANAIENLRNSPAIFFGQGNGDIGLLGNAYLRAADIPDADLPAARRAMGQIRDAMGGRDSGDYLRLFDDLMNPNSQTRRFFDDLTATARRDIEVETIRDRSVANAVVTGPDGRPLQVYGTVRTPEAIQIEVRGQPFVAEIRMARVGDGTDYYGWGTNDRWYPFKQEDRILNADGTLNRERAAQAIVNDINYGGTQMDALIPHRDWQNRRIEEQRLGAVGNGVVIDANGDPRRVVATAGSGEAIEIVTADRQRMMIEIRDGQIANGQRYAGFGTNEQWYPFPGNRGIVRGDGTLDIDAAREYITAQARAGNIDRDAMVPRDRWDLTRTPVGNQGLDQALQPLPDGQPQNRVDPTPGNTPPENPPPGNGNTPPGNTSPPNNGSTSPANDGQTPDRAQLPPASQPNDPLLPFHAIEREQRMRPPGPMVSPDGQRFDVMGVERGDDGNLRVRLRPEGQRVDALPSEAMFEMRATAPQTLAQPGNPVSFGREPWLTAGRNENGIVLRDPQNPERTTVVPESRAAEIFTPVGRDVTYQGETWRFQALQSPGWQPGVDRRGFQLVDPDNPERTVFVPENRAVDIRMRLGEDGEYRFGDVRHGVIRLQPMTPDRDFTMPLQPGMSFEARLRDREMEGPYRIAVGENGELTATGRIRNGTEVTQRIEPSDIAPRYVDVRSPDFNDRFQVDSFVHREANTRNRAISTEPTGLPLRDPAFGNLDGTPSPQLALGAQSLETQADFIRRNAGNLEPGQSPSLTVFNIAFSNEGEARRVLEAMRDFRQMHPDAAIRIVAYEPSFRSFEGSQGYRDLQAFIDNDRRVQLDFYGRDPSQREVIHAKGVVVNDQVLFSTGAVIDGSRNKADISVQLPPEGARAFNAYLNEAVIGDASVARRQELAANAAREGVLINDPEARLPYIARAQDGLIRGAERELTVSVSELRNPDTTRAIIERAEAGVNVQVQFREMDPESRRLLAEAQQRMPDRLRVEDVSAWQPRQHYNVIVADGQQAYVGTAYLWQNQQDMLQHGRSFENGVLLQGDAVRQLQAQMEALRTLQPANPGQRLLGPGQDPATSPQSRGDDPGIAPVALRTPTAPQPGDPGFEAYTQSRSAVERLNTGLNIAYGEPSEKLAVAAATVAVQQNLRVDEVALNPPSATLAGGTTAFVIERGGTRESDRYGTLPMQVAMQTPLEEGYRRLGEVAEQNRQQAPQVDRSQQQALDEEQRLSARRMA